MLYPLSYGRPVAAESSPPGPARERSGWCLARKPRITKRNLIYESQHRISYALSFFRWGAPRNARTERWRESVRELTRMFVRLCVRVLFG